MQLFSPGWMVAALAAGPDFSRLQEWLQRARPEHLGAIFIAIQVGLQVLSVLGTWGASRLLVRREDATFLNALKCWLLHLALGLGIGIVLGILLSVVARFHDPWRLYLVALGGGLMLLLILILIPMKVYTIGVLRAIGIYLVSAVLAGVGIFLAGGAAFAGFGKELMAIQWQNVIAPLRQEEAPAFAPPLFETGPSVGEIDQLLNAALHPPGPKPTLSEREAMARLLQQKLQARWRALPPHDQRARLVFQNQLFRYLAYLEDVKADRRLHPPAPAH